MIFNPTRRWGSVGNDSAAVVEPVGVSPAVPGEEVAVYPLREVGRVVAELRLYVVRRRVLVDEQVTRVRVAEELQVEPADPDAVGDRVDAAAEPVDRRRLRRVVLRREQPRVAAADRVEVDDRPLGDGGPERGDEVR